MLELKTQTKKEVIDIYSFDVFDTLITRTFATPEGVYLAMQNKMETLEIFKTLPETLKKNFYEIRQETQLFCTANQHVLNKKNDCSLNDIYAVIQNNFSLNDDETELLKNLEIETELTNIVPIDKNIKKVKTLVNAGEKVILISDMYLSADIIRQFLVKCDTVFEDIEIYTSGDTGKLKCDGTLYNLIKEKYPKSKWIHCGDNRISDDFVARLHGIKTERYYPETLKPYEKILLKDKKSVYKNLSVGISRIVRGFNKESRTFELGCSFAGPMLYGYVEWVLEQALRRGLKHLYFVARDGYVLKEIADIIIEQRKTDIQTHYFYSSRVANRIPDEENIEEFIQNFCDELPSLMSVEFFAQRLNITVEELKKFIEVKNKSKHLSALETDWLVKRVLSNKPLKDFIIEKNRPRKELFIKYIEQEIDLSKNDFAFVELNGTGRTQDNIVKLISERLNSSVISFFLISLSDMKQNKNSKKVFYFYPGEHLAGFLELFCRTEHGQTVGYKYANGVIVPVFEVKKYTQMEQWGYREYIEGIKLYTNLFCKYINLNTVNNLSFNLFENYFKYFRYNIDHNMEELIRKIPFLIYGNETMVKEYLPKYNLYNILTNINTCKNFLATKHHSFIKKSIFLIVILSNKFNLKINIKRVYELYYKYFLK